METQFAGDGADLPVFGVKVAANLRTGFGTDHQQTSPSSWNARERVNETRGSTTDPAAQANAGQFFRPAGQPSGVGWRRYFYNRRIPLPTYR
jgi:hypothetical protein